MRAPSPQARVRTEPASLRVPGAPLIAPLRRVLLAPALHQPQVGYCQGLNFIAAILLLHGDEATAFVLLCRLCGELLPGYHSPAMPGLHAGQDVLMEALRLCLPACHARLAQAQVPVREHSTHWLLCLYINVLPLASAMRLWDLLFAEVRT